MSLTAAEIEIYHRDGLVTPSEFKLSADALKQFDALYRKLLGDNGDGTGFSPDLIFGPRLDSGGKIKEEAGSAHGYSNRALFLLRGEDKSGRNDFARGHA